MLEWVCAGCGRDVDPSFRVCPFCGKSEPLAPSAKLPEAEPQRGGRRAWSTLDRGFYWGLGLVAALVLGYFVLIVVAHLSGRDDWVERLLRWMGLG